MRYRMIAIDLDGTLLNRRGRVSEANASAIARAREAGVIVVPCTGRAWRESKATLDVLPMEGPGVFVTGAAVSDIQTGRSLDLSVIEPHLALRIVEHLWGLPEAVLVFRDLELAGHDYLVTGRGELLPNTQWWFRATGATVRYQTDIRQDDLHHSLRVAVVAKRSRIEAIKSVLSDSLAGEISMHSFQAIQEPDPRDNIHILEIFARGVDKWRGIDWVAHQHGIDTADVAAIGDEINDLAMLASAGCGIAMGNAIDRVKAVARHVTHACDADGVAHAIDNLLAGVWG